MKILQVISTPPFAWATGGCARVAYELSKELVKRGHDVTILTTDLYEPSKRYVSKSNPEYIDGIRIFRFRIFSNFLAWERGIYISPGIVKYLRNHLSEYDVIHLQDIISYQAIATYKYCKKYNIPYILTTHGSVPRLYGKGLIWFYRIIFGNNVLKNAYKIIAVSKAEVHQFDQTVIDTNKIINIPNGINTELFKELPKLGKFREKYEISEKYMILFLGRIHKRKGIDYLIKSFSEFREEMNDAILVIIGNDDGYLTEVKKIINNLNLNTKIKVIDYISEQDKIAAYVDADLLVYPATLEIFGLVPFEAIMCGTPVIVTNDCGCGELVRDASCGYLVKYGDIDGLKKKMKNINEKPDDGRKMVENGKKYIEKNLTWDEVAKKIEELYKTIIPSNQIGD